MKKKVLVMCPHFPPEKSGLADYCEQFVSELSKTCDVSVVCNSSEERFGRSDFRILPVMESWSCPHQLARLGSIMSEGYDRILVQYVPYMYSRRAGLNPVFPLFILWRRCLGYEISMMTHEINYPFLADANMKSLALSLIHRFMYFFMVLASKNVFCSCEAYVTQTSRYLLGIKSQIFHLPVGSNIRNNGAGEEELDAVSKELGHQDKVRLVAFGSGHVSKRPDLVMRAVSNHPDVVHLFIVGEVSASSRGNISTLGHCEAEKVSRILTVVDGMVSYFMAGVSTRRGSAIAAIEHGLPLYTTWGWHGSEVFRDRPGVILSSDDDESYLEGFNIFVGKLKNGEMPSPDFADCFSWQSIVEKWKKVEGLSSLQ